MAPRRRSARLAGTAAKNQNQTAPPSHLGSLDEHDEREDGGSSLPPNPTTSPRVYPSTPVASSTLKPSRAEMHPSKAQQTMAPPSAGLVLGFTDINPSAKSRHQPSGIAQTTPSKSTALPSSPFNFHFTRQPADMGLSSKAQQMMAELREDAAKIKAELIAKRDQDLAGDRGQQFNGRKIAMPKGKAGRFSAAHITEFKKMDSIEGHASAFRAQPGRFTPLTGIKRSSSRANLDDMPSVTVRSAMKRSPSKAKLDERDAYGVKKPDATSNSPKPANPFEEDPPSPAKRVKQHLGDDASSSRPISRDGSFIPRPKSNGTDAPSTIPRSRSTLALLMSPTKASLARAAPGKNPLGSMVRSSTKGDLSSLKKSATTNNLRAVSQKTSALPQIVSPGRFEKVKSLLRGSRSTANKAGSALPLPSLPVSKMPAPPPPPSRTEKALPPLPVTSPRRKLVKRMDFTPSETRAALSAQNSPLLSRSALPRSKTSHAIGEVHYPALDSVISGKKDGDVEYPDLSAYGGFPSSKVKEPEPSRLPQPSVAGVFTFRCDNTISFGSASPTGFGSSPGQSSVRHVRPSILPIPGGFPVESDKENKPPKDFLPGISHGMKNKKRHRVSSDEEDAEREAAERAAKKRKNEHVAEGEALLAPKLISMSGAASPAKRQERGGLTRTAGRLSPAKKRSGLSISRLNMLARPKMRQ